MSVLEETPKPWLSVPAAGPILRPNDAAAYLGYSTPRYYALVAAGELPAPIKIGRGQNGASGVPRPWLDAVIAHHAAESLAA
jgi:predicted DNA-binding transcriptional regulator AlpA